MTVLAEETLHFQDAHQLHELLGGDLRILNQLEARLGLRLVSRDGWVKVSGKPEPVAVLKRMFQELLKARAHGVTIRRHELFYILAAVEAGQEPHLEELWRAKIPSTSRRPDIVPKTLTQKNYLDAIRRHDLTLGIGPAGTGKTFLAVALAAAALRAGEYRRLILTRPAVEAGEALGFLPGDLNEKISPYLRPLYDALHDLMGGEEVARLSTKGMIEMAPLAYMRGRTLSGSFVILDEAQNATCEQMLMFLTRLGPASKCVVTGDPTQIDLPHHRKSGLVEAIQALHHVEGVAIVRFDDLDVIRHELVGRIVRAYREYRSARDSHRQR